MKLLHVLSVIILILILKGCSHIPKQPTGGKYAPVVNSHSKYFMKVNGRVDSKLESKINLEWIADYYTTNDKCRVVTNALEGVSISRQKAYKYKIYSNKQGYFNIKIPLDNLKSGYCKWKLFDLTLKLVNKKNGVGMSYINFRDNKKTQSKISINYNCDFSSCYYAKNSRLIPTYDANRKYLKNIDLQFNAIQRNKHK